MKTESVRASSAPRKTKTAQTVDWVRRKDAGATGVRTAKTPKRSQTGPTPSKYLPNDERPGQTAGQMNIDEKALHENPPVFMNVDDSETWLDEPAEPIISLKKKVS